MADTRHNKNSRENDPRRYDDIIDRERPVSRTHIPMSLDARAAQFAPFAALSGYGNVIRDAREQHLLAGDGIEAVPVVDAEDDGNTENSR